MFTRKHYRAFADMVKNNSQEFTGLNGLITVNMVRTRFCNDLADYFAADNPQFDRERFLTACGIGLEPDAEEQTDDADADDTGLDAQGCDTDGNRREYL